jgi:hypothetical protein
VVRCRGDRGVTSIAGTVAVDDLGTGVAEQLGGIDAVEELVGVAAAVDLG